MGDVIIFFFCQNIIIFSLIFWFLTWACEYFYKKKNHLTKRQVYECGFKSFDNLNIQINLNFILLCVFLVLYDVEFLFLVPILFNLYNIMIYHYIILLLFFILIVISLLYDFQMHALSWQW
jgi:NADH-quinone oxidoreductase subunit A